MCRGGGGAGEEALQHKNLDPTCKIDPDFETDLEENRLSEMVLMTGHNICFKGVIWKIIPKLTLLPLLIWSTENFTRQVSLGINLKRETPVLLQN